MNTFGRTRTVIGNWKMNTSLGQALELARASAELADELDGRLDLGVAPPMAWLVHVAEHVRGSSLRIGAQDASPDPDGARTGDVSMEMIGRYVSFVIAGHSERRQIHGETDDLVRRKVERFQTDTCGPLLCVGESLAQREAGTAVDTVVGQLDAALKGYVPGDGGPIIVAYEPVWAIGTGLAATTDDAAAMISRMREWLRSRFGADGDQIRLLYGGSVSGENAADLMNVPELDGLLVGSASLRADEFGAIARAAVV